MDILTQGERVAVYNRCSTAQQVNSIADQDAEVMRVVDRNKLQVVKTYSDEGISGSTIDERDALKEMIAEIGALDVKIILVYNLSRLTRGGLVDFWALFAMFNEKGVRIYNCQSGQFIDENNAASALLACVEASQAKASNMQLSRDITRTMIANVKERKNSPGSRPPYGYDRLYIDEAGRSFQQVRWNSSSLRDILLNPAYVGDLVFNRTHKGRCHGIKDGQVEQQHNPSGKVKFKDNPKDEWIIIPDAHEALIPREEWEAVQLALQARSKSSVKSGRSVNRCYPLSGIIVCGHCGSPMQGMCVGKRRYICSKRRKNGKSQCIPCSVDAEKTEEFVIGKVRAELLSECVTYSLREGLERIYDSMRLTMDDVESEQRELDKLQKRKNDLFAKLTTADDLSFFRGQIDAMKEEEERRRKRLAMLKAESGRRLDKAEFLRKCFDLYENQVLQLKGGCESAIRESLRALGTKVVYNPNGKDGTIEVDPFVHSVED